MNRVEERDLIEKLEAAAQALPPRNRQPPSFEPGSVLVPAFATESFADWVVLSRLAGGRVELSPLIEAPAPGSETPVEVLGAPRWWVRDVRVVLSESSLSEAESIGHVPVPPPDAASLRAKDAHDEAELTLYLESVQRDADRLEPELRAEPGRSGAGLGRLMLGRWRRAAVVMGLAAAVAAAFLIDVRSPETGSLIDVRSPETGSLIDVRSPETDSLAEFKHRDGLTFGVQLRSGGQTCLPTGMPKAVDCPRGRLSVDVVGSKPSFLTLVELGGEVGPRLLRSNDAVTPTGDAWRFNHASIHPSENRLAAVFTKKALEPKAFLRALARGEELEDVAGLENAYVYWFTLEDPL